MTSSKQYELTLSENGKYVIIRLKKNMTGDLQSIFAKDAIATAREHNTNRFLADFRGIRNETAPSEHYNHGYNELKDFSMDRHAKVALLADHGDGSFNVLITVLSNAGYNFRLFYDLETAENWLKH